MLQMADDDFLKHIKTSDSEFNTMADIHKILTQRNIQCSIEDLRERISSLYRDGYLGNAPDTDGVNMYYIVFYPGIEG